MPRKLTTSSMARMLRMSALATQVSTSLAAGHALNFWLSDPIANARRSERFVRNAFRVSEALGELKGAAMKVGQMLSTHEGFLPPEVCQVLQSLQRDAPPIPYHQMRTVLEQSLPQGLATFASLTETPIAAASIGQVYRGTLRDGRDVVVKVQYPGIDKVIRADLNTLKKLFGSLLEMFTEIAFEPLWEELRERLLEELDYHQEAQNISRMRAQYEGDPQIMIPAVLSELSNERVLVMEFMPGIPPQQASSTRYEQPLRDHWGAGLMRFTMQGLLTHRFLHADPNFGNFAFREDGRLIVYDYGCVKAVPEHIATGCAAVLQAALQQDLDAIPARLKELGIWDRGRRAPVTRAVIDPLAAQVLRIVNGTPYGFSADDDLYRILLDRNGQYLTELTRLELPAELMFVNRTLSGLYGNLCQLRATGNWREVLSPLAANG
ncbi:MAG: AarF/ABC1/UbiB kinase family protein [Pseudomonadota bacterium]